MAYCVLGVLPVARVTARLADIDANLDDLQSGIEACSRAANTLQADTTMGAVGRHVRDLQACVRDQRDAMQELRDGVSRLLKELRRINGAGKPPVCL